jgi:flagellar biosynthesis protein FlhF
VESLRSRYGEQGFKILNHAEVYSEGLFNRLWGNKEMEVQYVVLQKPLSFEAEKQKILNITGKTAVPFAELDKKLGAYGELLNSILEKIAPGDGSHPAITKIEGILEKNEFTGGFIKKISQRLKKELPLGDLEDEALVHRTVLDWIGAEIRIKQPPAIARPPRVVVLVGPTGVGKTTTIVKLAAKYRIQENSGDYKPLVRIATVDSFRIAAFEQLEKQADILGFPVHKAETPGDIPQILAMDEGRLDALFIDTIGCSPTDYEGIAAMRSLINIPHITPETYLTVSASTKASDLRMILKNYESFDYKAVIVTKLDETSRPGNIISVLSERNVPVAFVTTGQKPKQIEDPSPITFLRKLADFNIGREYFDDSAPPVPGGT